MAEGAWLGAALLLWRSHLPARPASGAETTELGTESPAIVNLLTHGWRVTRAAGPATLLDLAARRLVTIDWVGESYICRIRARGRPRGLRPYEKRVLELLRDHAVDGVVPANVLDTGAQPKARQWWKAFSREVVEDAKEQGLSRDAWDPRVTWILGGFGAVAFALGGLAAVASRPAAPSSPWGTLFAVAYGIAIPLAIATTRLGWSDTQRDTPQGLEVAGRWLGVRRALAADGTFHLLPPPGVAIWDRYLAYAAAMSVASRAITGLPLAAEDDHRAWARDEHGWRPVRVWYPRVPGWGNNPRRTIVRSVPVAIAATLAFALLVPPARDFPWFGVPLLMATAAVAVWHLAAAVLAVLDLGAPVERTGRVLRLRARPRFSFSPKPEYEHRWYVAVDDGRSDVALAWLVPRAIYDSLAEGQTVAAQVTRRLRHVNAIERVDGRGRRRSVSRG